VKVGDLVTVGPRHPGATKPFVSVVLEICTPEMQASGMHLIKVVERSQSKWYPIGYIEVINEDR
jgi:hypothetical protein